MVLGDQLAHVGCAESDLWLGHDKNQPVICPTFEPKSYLMTSIEPIRSMLIHTIIYCYVQMVIINGFGVVIWPKWVVLSQICGWGVTKISL
jgi:hypothetical protein